jgi:hypothetical protein
MSAELDQLLSRLSEQERQAIYGVLKNLNSSSSEYVRNKSRDIQEYLEDLATGKINKGTFDDLVSGVLVLEDIDSAQIETSKKVLVQKALNEAKSLLLDGLSKLL